MKMDGFKSTRVAIGVRMLFIHVNCTSFDSGMDFLETLDDKVTPQVRYFSNF